MSSGDNWYNSVQVEGGGFMRLEDYCNSTPKGNHLGFTVSVVETDEELLGIECGWRVANYVIEYACTGWDALLDASYAEYCRTGVHHG